MDRNELKETILKDLNSDEYPFIINVKGNTIIGRWKSAERNDTFSVRYTLRKDNTFYGGEATVKRKDYKPPMDTKRTAVFSIEAPEQLPWRKKVDPKEWANIENDEQKLFSIIEHYLTDHGFSYKPAAWNHAYINWNDGFYFRAVGIIFMIVGAMLFWGLFSSELLLLKILILLYTACGAWLFLIGIGKAEFYTLQPKILVKVVLGTIVVGWLLIFLLMFLEHIGIKVLP